MSLPVNQIIRYMYIGLRKSIGGEEMEEQPMNTSSCTYFSDGVQALSKHQEGLTVCLCVEVKAPEIIQNLQYTKQVITTLYMNDYK